MKNCLGCQCNQDTTIAPGGHIKVYKHWILAHIIEPVPIIGWLVLKTKRHAEGIMEMNSEESNELGKILNIVPKVVQKITGAEMVYALCITELVAHLHFHIIPRLPDSDVRGTELFMKLKDVRENPTKAVCITDCLDVIKRIKQLL